MLMNQVKQGELGSAAILFERYQVSIYNFFFRLSGDLEESKDLTQSTFHRILKYRKSFKDRHTFRSWIFKLARNQFYDSYRKSKNRKSYLQDSEKDFNELPDQEEYSKQRDHRELEDALRQLPDDYRELIILSKYQGLKYDEIAKVVGSSKGAIKMKTHRAMLKLREVFYEERTVS